MTELKADRITQKYLRRWPDSRLAKSWAGRMVHIETENGVWRTGGAGYTWAGKPDAWVLPFEEARRQVNHCGPEKRAAFIAVPAHSPSPSIPEGEVEAAARATCRTGGYDPDEMMANDGPRWRYYVEGARAAIEVEVADTWQDIATAPKDGTEILVFVRTDEGAEMQQVAHWDGAPTAEWPWQVSDGSAYHRDLFTHWQPLLNPPPRTP